MGRGYAYYWECYLHLNEEIAAAAANKTQDLSPSPPGFPWEGLISPNYPEVVGIVHDTVMAPAWHRVLGTQCPGTYPMIAG